jgi:hypothetical protein
MVIYNQDLLAQLKAVTEPTALLAGDRVLGVFIPEGHPRCGPLEADTPLDVPDGSAADNIDRTSGGGFGGR